MNESRFPNGRYEGRGEWVDKKGGRGRYTTAYEIVDEADNRKTQLTHREFLNADGSRLYEEDSTVTFKVIEGPFVEVAIGFRMKKTTEYPDDRHIVTTTLPSEEKISVGQGDWFNDSLHYDLDVTEDNHLENTYIFSDGKIELLGSATNKGNYTVWTETLYRVE